MDRPTPQGPIRIRSQTAPVLLRDTFGLAVALSAARARLAPGRRVVVEERCSQILGRLRRSSAVGGRRAGPGGWWTCHRKQKIAPFIYR